MPGALVVAVIAFPITYLLALGSWHAIEKRALRLKGPLAGPRTARSTARRPATPAAEPAPAPAPAQV